jgi:hypothetical protein
VLAYSQALAYKWEHEKEKGDLDTSNDGAQRRQEWPWMEEGAIISTGATRGQNEMG